jgi:hypothetical protein
MLQYLQSLKAIMQKDVILDRREAIKRYRSLTNFNQQVLQLLCMTEFFMLYKNRKGDIEMV